MLSIILPVYNAGNYIEKCLESILFQSFSNFELILINDGSQDNSASICQSFAKKDNRIVYFDQKNQGVAITRNKGLELAKGDYIGFVDADDTLERSMFENLMLPFTQHDLDLVIGHYKICNTDSVQIPKSSIPVNKILNSEEIKNKILKTYYEGNDPLVPALWNKIYKKNFLKQNHLNFQNQKTVKASDYWFNFEVFQKASRALVISNADYLYNNAILGSITNTFRENQFEGFVNTKSKLLEANKRFKFNIDHSKFDKPFFENSNQYILSAINSKGYFRSYSIVKSVLRNEAFISSSKNVTKKRFHLRIISFLNKNNMSFLTYICFCIWCFLTRIRT